MEPTKAEVSYTFVTSIEEVKVLEHVIRDIPTKYSFKLSGIGSMFYVGAEKPDLKPGDRVEFTIRKRP